MPTESLETILYRDLSKVAAKDLIELASGLLRELVNYATKAYQRCVDATTQEENVDLAVLMLYLHIIEMADGVEVLIAQACATPAIPLVRSAFEALISIEYILERNYVQRSLSWLAIYAHNRIRSYELLDPTTNRGVQFQAAKATDNIARDVLLDDVIPRARASIANMQSLLKRSQFHDIETEIKKFKRLPNWYQLFGGPASIEQLAQRLHRQAQYQILYRQWSSIAHAHDASRFIKRMSSTDPTSRVLRDPSDMREVAGFTATFILSATRLMLGKFRPSENLASWYLQEIRERYRLIHPED